MVARVRRNGYPDRRTEKIKIKPNARDCGRRRLVDATKRRRRFYVFSVSRPMQDRYNTRHNQQLAGHVSVSDRDLSPLRF